MQQKEDDNKKYAAIDPNLYELSRLIEENEFGLRVIGAKYHDVDCSVFEVDILTQIPKRFNILEEFVLRAINQYKPSPPAQLLAQIMGLDELFIKSAIENLMNGGIIENKSNDEYVFTKIGEQAFIDRMYQKIVIDTGLHFLLIHKINSLSYLPKIPEILISNQISQQSFVDIKNPNNYLEINSVISALEKGGSSFHAPDLGRTVIGVKKYVQTMKSVLNCPVFLLLDELKFSLEPNSDNISLRFINPIDNERVYGIDNDKIKLSEIFPSILFSKHHVYDDIQDVVAENGLEIQQNIDNKIGENKFPSSTAASEILKESNRDNIKFLFGEEIRPEFLKQLRQSEYFVMFISPWVTEEVIDDVFISDIHKLAQKNVFVLIGWGINRTKERENRVPPKQLLNKLHSIHAKDGLPAVNVIWLGMMHNKDLLIDAKIHLSGSHNFLSYRGDHLCRGESVYCVAQKDIIQHVLGKLEPVFDNGITRIWKENIKSLDKNELYKCCISWVYVNKPDKAMLEIHKYYNSKGGNVDPDLMNSLFQGVLRPLLRTNFSQENYSILKNMLKEILAYDIRLSTLMKNLDLPLQSFMELLAKNPLTLKYIRQNKRHLQKYLGVIIDM